jgi:hypothetical protein
MVTVRIRTMRAQPSHKAPYYAITAVQGRASTVPQQTKNLLVERHVCSSNP